MSSRPHFLEPLLRATGVGHQLVNERTGSLVATDLEFASDSRARNRGLLGRSGIAAGSAMIIAPCNAIHTFFMRFPIDVVFADRRGDVVKLCRDVKPWRICAGLRGFAAIEMTAGSIDRCELQHGDRVKIVSAGHAAGSKPPMNPQFYDKFGRPLSCYSHPSYGPLLRWAWGRKVR